MNKTFYGILTQGKEAYGRSMYVESFTVDHTQILGQIMLRYILSDLRDCGSSGYIRSFSLDWPPWGANYCRLYSENPCLTHVVSGTLD